MHWLVIGMTESGKSSLLKELGSSLREAGQEVIACNPTGEAGYTRRDKYGRAGAEWETRDPAELVREAHKRFYADRKKRRFLITDEAYEIFPRGGSENLWLVTSGRHVGFTVIAGTQASQQIEPRARTQFGGLYCFRCALTDAKFAADQWGKRELLGAPDLPTGHYFRVAEGQLTRGRAFG